MDGCDRCGASCWSSPISESCRRSRWRSLLSPPQAVPKHGTDCRVLFIPLPHRGETALWPSPPVNSIRVLFPILAIDLGSKLSSDCGGFITDLGEKGYGRRDCCATIPISIPQPFPPLWPYASRSLFRVSSIIFIFHVLLPRLDLAF